MKLRQLLSWRFSLIFFHRWLGILVGLMFVVWCISGVVLMYYGVPHLSAGERLSRLPALDLSTVAVSPAQALERTGGNPFRLRISMHGDRPVYRINTGAVFGRWALVYADTGEVMQGLDQEAAMDWLGTFVPEHAGALRYEAYLQGPDTFTHLPAMQTHMPMHRIALDDAAATEYYVSERSGEAVMKTDRWSRLLGITGYQIHTLFFFRQQSWWGPLLNWLSWLGLAMTILGLVLGIWRFALKPRFVQRGSVQRTPYQGWYKWHHYAGLIFGIFMLTWMFSGLVSRTQIPGIGGTAYSPAQIQAGARNLQGQGAYTDFAPLTIAGMRQAAAAAAGHFPVKELELLYFNDEPYYIAYRPPNGEELDNWQSRSALDFLTPTLEQEHLMISAIGPEAEPFTHFSEAQMLEAARRAMPGADIIEMQWLDEHDDYYYHTVSSFDLGLPRAVRSLPVLRLKFNDAEATWLYLTPSHGQMLKAERLDRRDRWAYYGLHGLDFAFLYDNRPLWDIVVIMLLGGATVLSCTTLVPMYRRLKRHALRLAGGFRGPAGYFWRYTLKRK